MRMRTLIYYIIITSKKLWTVPGQLGNYSMEHIQLHPRVIMEREAGLLPEYQALTAAQQV